MRTLTLLFSLVAISIGSSTISFAGEPRLYLIKGESTEALETAERSCAANSADRTKSCKVTCPAGKAAQCSGGNTDSMAAHEVECTCR